MVRLSSRRWLVLSAVVAAVATAGCAAMHRSAQRTSPQAPAGPSDANIAAIFLAANNTDISYAELAPTQASRADVKAFAQQMETDHGGLNRSLTALLNQINLAPEDNSVSFDLRDESAFKRDTLRELSGHAFDSAYMVNEVRYHTKLLVAIDSVLLPHTRNPQLKEFITNVRPAVVAHLEHAQRVQAAVGGR